MAPTTKAAKTNVADSGKHEVAVVGLGYVGLPLAAAFGQRRTTVGFDVDAGRIKELRGGTDRNGEHDRGEILAPHIRYTADEADLKSADIFIVAVPTPVTDAKTPDLRYLLSASELVGRALKARKKRKPTRRATVVFESTVYPGCTEEVCAPAIAEASGLPYPGGFDLGYSPERINPGDPNHGLRSIIKVVGANEPEVRDRLAALYGEVVEAGIHVAPSIKVAEAAKVIENTQRDINIALMNELAVLLHRLDIDTGDVLAAVRTKWNALPFVPGLVGGHCIPEDPYYLTYCAQRAGLHPEVILSGRRTNDRMGTYVADETIRLLGKRGALRKGTRILILGATFKENVPDIRSTRVKELIAELRDFGADLRVHDPLVAERDWERLGAHDCHGPPEGKYDAIVLAVPHRKLLASGSATILQHLAPEGILVDVRGVLQDEGRALGANRYWRL